LAETQLIDDEGVLVDGVTGHEEVAQGLADIKLAHAVEPISAGKKPRQASPCGASL